MVVGSIRGEAIKKNSKDDIDCQTSLFFSFIQGKDAE
jgi:hypothetical protein